MKCQYHEIEMDDPIDATYSDIKTERCEVGQHTGDIYYCEKCDMQWLHNLLTDKMEHWNG